MTTMIDIVRLLKQKGYNCIWNGACNIEFLDNYNFHTIPKGFIFKVCSLSLANPKPKKLTRKYFIAHLLAKRDLKES